MDGKSEMINFAEAIIVKQEINDDDNDDDDVHNLESDQPDYCLLSDLAPRLKRSSSVVCVAKQESPPGLDDTASDRVKVEASYLIDDDDPVVPCAQSKDVFDNDNAIIKTEQHLLQTEVVVKSEAEDESSMRIECNDKSYFLLEKKSKCTTYQCEICTKQFTMYYLYKAHFLDHMNYRPFQCLICGKSYKKRGDLRYHHMTHTDERNIACEVCGKKFRINNALKCHMRIHTGEKPYNCKHCPKTFTGLNHLKSHVRSHTDARPFKCPDCNQAFKQPHSYKEHRKTHTDVYPFKCDVCGRQFQRNDSYRFHRQEHDAPALKCDTCAKIFKRDSYLKRHMKIHERIKPYQCGYCDQSYTDSIMYKTHVRKHTGEEPYECRVCARRFRRKDSYRYHVRSHSGGNSVSCIVCSKVISCRSSLRLHLRTQHHTQLDEGYEMVACRVCNVKVLDGMIFVKHMMTVHSIDVYRCYICKTNYEDQEIFRSHRSMHDDQDFVKAEADEEDASHKHEQPPSTVVN